MKEDKLQKIIANAGICSRRKAELLILQKRIRINGEIASIGNRGNINCDEITLDGKRIHNNKKITVILINKPMGYISSCYDKQGRPTLISLIPNKIRLGLYPIGRLDLYSRGAILVTNHGELALKLTHPRYSHPKTYHVLVKGCPSKESLQGWREGLILDDKKTKGVKINILESKKAQTLLEVIMTEGRKRQIRRIANIIGNDVIDLKREAIGSIRLNNLEEGNWRILKNNEWCHFISPSKNIT